MAKVKLVNAKYSYNKYAKVRRNIHLAVPYVSLICSVIAMLKAFNVII